MYSAESATRIANPKRLDGIDLLRGLAIVFVLLDHVHIRLWLSKIPYDKFLPAQLAHFLDGNGGLGVQMFFVVSGFLITSISLRRPRFRSKLRITVKRLSPIQVAYQPDALQDGTVAPS